MAKKGEGRKIRISANDVLSIEWIKVCGKLNSQSVNRKRLNELKKDSRGKQLLKQAWTGKVDHNVAEDIKGLLDKSLRDSIPETE